jgi:endonuclease YncB( thermonuclease family)
VVKVVDGDTIKLDVMIWPHSTQQVNLRLSGVNTPEKRGKNISQCEKDAAQKATNFTQQWLKGVDIITVYDVELGKYAGRALGKIRKGGVDLGEALLKSGNARPYSGGKRKPWCTEGG